MKDILVIVTNAILVTVITNNPSAALMRSYRLVF